MKRLELKEKISQAILMTKTRVKSRFPKVNLPAPFKECRSSRFYESLFLKKEDRLYREIHFFHIRGSM